MTQVSSYEIDLSFKGLKYEGKNKISLSTDDVVLLDSVGHEIRSVTSSGTPINFVREGDKVRIFTGKFSGAIEVNFSGKVDEDGIVGIYKAPYEGSYVISTQFEASYARRFIPCVDDPSQKARFLLRVEVDKDQHVISNMPESEVRELGDRKVVTFQETPPMSTYLLYLGIGNFEEMREDDFRFPIILATVPGKLSRGKFALDIAKKSVQFYEEYFSIPYQLPKMHLIAVPEFSAGAMENWGAITFREVALLVDDKSPFSRKRRVAVTIAHEIAHQWFGDLVTMKWWDDLWLNESFATFMSHKAMDEIRKDWDLMGYFVFLETSEAMERDSLFTHPIHVPVKSPEEIEEIFDEISYGKGASILRMIEGYIGEENFRKGVSSYLKKFSFSNAKACDLWSSLSEASGKDVNSIMEEWITHEGYPVLKVRKEGGKIKVTQERFSLVDSQDRVYKVPVTAEVDGRPMSFLMQDREVTLQGSSVKVNLSRTGFYRVFYEDLDSFFETNPNPFERWGLMNDYFAFLLKGMISTEDYLTLLKRMEDEDHHLPASEVVSQVTLLHSISPEKWGLGKQILSKYAERWKERTSEVDRQTYAGIVDSLSYMDREYASTIAPMFEKMDTLIPEMKDAVAVAYSVASGEKGYEKLLQLYRESRFDEEKLRYMRGMLASHQGYLVANTLNMALSGEVKKQDIPFMVIWGSTFYHSRDATWQWFKAHLQTLSRYYQGTPRIGVIMGSIIPYVGLRHDDVLDVANNVREGRSFIEVGKQKLQLYRRLM